MPEVPGSSEGQREGQNQPRGLAPRRRPARGRSARLAETRVWGACGGEPAAPGDAGPCLETLGSVWGAEGGRPGPEGLRGSPGLCQQRPGRSPSTSPGLGRPSASQTYPRATRRSQAPPETAGSPPQTSKTRARPAQPTGPTPGASSGPAAGGPCLSLPPGGTGCWDLGCPLAPTSGPWTGLSIWAQWPRASTSSLLVTRENGRWVFRDGAWPGLRWPGPGCVAKRGRYWVQGGRRPYWGPGEDKERRGTGRGGGWGGRRGAAGLLRPGSRGTRGP